MKEGWRWGEGGGRGGAGSEGVEEGGGSCREGRDERIIRGEEGKRRGGRKGGEEERKE